MRAAATGSSSSEMPAAARRLTRCGGQRWTATTPTTTPMSNAAGRHLRTTNSFTLDARTEAHPVTTMVRTAMMVVGPGGNDAERMPGRH
jgi:hypothetical protein